MKHFITTLFLFSISLSGQALEVPRLSSPVMDQAGLLSKQVRAALVNALVRVKQQTGNEIAILTVKSLEGDSIDG
ncbi:MAG: TPM domain-containing protein, partial [Deltaproteobacteria bacterium]